MTAYVRVWWCLAGATWLVACLIALASVATGALIVVAVFVGANTAAFSLAATTVDDRHERRLAAAGRNAVVAAATTVAVLGLVAGLGGAGFLIGAMFACTSPPIADRLRCWHERQRTKESEAQPMRPCSDMSTAELVRAWRTSFSSLSYTESAAATSMIVARRQMYLDELERRDPEGIRRWLESGARAASDPTRYLSG